MRQLVELHGGTVRVESAGHDQGVTFIIMLPLLSIRHEPASEDTPRVHPTTQIFQETKPCPPELENLRVLVVDDEADTREILMAILVKCGADVESAESVSEALKRLEEGNFNVLVSDIGMPEEDGYELIRKVRELPKERGRRLPAVALTAYARAEDRVRVLRSGYQIHVSKPVEPTELIAVIANIAGRTGDKAEKNKVNIPHWHISQKHLFSRHAGLMDVCHLS